jgi:MFS transporter, Spinster family, sphingosine-1-phosphate transporter
VRSLTPRQTLVILTGLNLFNYFDRYVLSAVLPSLQAEMGLDDTRAGHLATIFMLGYFVTSPFFGWLGDRASRKWLIAGGILVWSSATVMTGFASSVAILMFWRAMVGVGEASYATVSPAWLSDVYPAEKRNNALTIFYTAIPIGAALGSVIGGWIALHQGWRHAFIWAGAPGLLLALLLLPFKEPARTGSGDGSHQLPGLKDILALFKRRDYNLSVWGYTAYTFALGAMAHWGPSFLHRSHQLGIKEAGDFFGYVLVGAGLAGTMLGGLAATAWQKRHRSGYAGTLALSMLLGAPAAWIAFTSPDKTTAMASLAIAMFCCFLGTGPINTLILESAPTALRASAMAGSIFIIHLFGDLWSPSIVGMLSDHWSSLSKGLLILPAVLLLAGVLWGLLAWLQHRSPKPVES